MAVLLKSVSFAFPDKSNIFSDLSLEISSGSTCLLKGGNGSGKTTLGKIICGFLAPTAGIVTVDEIVPHALRGIKRLRVASFVPQHTMTYFLSNTVISEVKSAIRRIYGGDGSFSDEISALLHQFMLTEFSETHPNDLSVSVAWRLALLLGSISNPAMLFIDEVPQPSSQVAFGVINHIIRARELIGGVTVIATHRDTRLDNICNAEIVL